MKLAAVAVVAQAVWGMGRKLCPDRARITLALGAAGLVLLFSGAIPRVGGLRVSGIFPMAKVFAHELRAE